MQKKNVIKRLHEAYLQEKPSGFSFLINDVSPEEAEVVNDWMKKHDISGGGLPGYSPRKNSHVVFTGTDKDKFETALGEWAENYVEEKEVSLEQILKTPGVRLQRVGIWPGVWHIVSNDHSLIEAALTQIEPMWQEPPPGSPITECMSVEAGDYEITIRNPGLALSELLSKCLPKKAEATR